MYIILGGIRIRKGIPLHTVAIKRGIGACIPAPYHVAVLDFLDERGYYRCTVSVWNIRGYVGHPFYNEGFCYIVVIRKKHEIVYIQALPRLERIPANRCKIHLLKRIKVTVPDDRVSFKLVEA